MAVNFLAGLVQQKFWLWFLGIPAFGAEWRWLRKQRKDFTPDDAFKTFVLGLTPRYRALPAGAIELLAARAFLEDVRVAYQPRLWRPSTWRLGRRPVLVLDRLDNALADLLFRARQGRTPDPLLAVLVPPDGDSRPPSPHEVVAEVGEFGAIRYPRAARPWLVLAGVPALALCVAAGLLVAQHGTTRTPVASVAHRPPVIHHRPGTSGTVAAARSLAPPCQLPPGLRMQAAAAEFDAGPHDRECVGYSSTAAVIFSNQTYPDEPGEQQGQDQRVRFDEGQIFLQNARADQAHQQTGRTEVGLVYFAGITEGAGEDYDSGEAEELEGLLAAQQNAYRSGASVPVLKIVVANGGSKMRDAAAVANMLLPLFQRDSDLLGVVGLDRSITPVQTAIDAFTGHQIPVLATTLSADGFGGGSPYYFQLSPGNSDEARLILRYIDQTVPRYFEQPASQYYSAGQTAPSRVTIYEPNPDPADKYLGTLVTDLQHDASPGLAKKLTLTHDHSTALLCGAATVDIYAGRHDRPVNVPGTLDDFGTFMQTINGCDSKQKPFIIADDGVTRFVADPAARAEEGLGDQPISYVTKGLAILGTGNRCLSPSTVTGGAGTQLGDFCSAYAAINGELKSQGVTLYWTGERVGLAYDAAWMFLKADIFRGTALTRTELPSAFQDYPYAGVTGTVRFTPTSHTGADTAGGMPLAVVRIALSDPTAMPVCAVTGNNTQPSDTTPNPANCLHGQI
jgi:hypothetical protein